MSSKLSFEQIRLTPELVAAQYEYDIDSGYSLLMSGEGFVILAKIDGVEELTENDVEKILRFDNPGHVFVSIVITDSGKLDSWTRFLKDYQDQVGMDFDPAKFEFYFASYMVCARQVGLLPNPHKRLRRSEDKEEQEEQEEGKQGKTKPVDPAYVEEEDDEDDERTFVLSGFTFVIPENEHSTVYNYPSSEFAIELHQDLSEAFDDVIEDLEMKIGYEPERRKFYERELEEISEKLLGIMKEILLSLGGIQVRSDLDFDELPLETFVFTRDENVYLNLFDLIKRYPKLDISFTAKPYQSPEQYVPSDQFNSLVLRFKDALRMSFRREDCPVSRLFKDLPAFDSYFP